MKSYLQLYKKNIYIKFPLDMFTLICLYNVKTNMFIILLYVINIIGIHTNEIGVIHN